MPIYAYKCESCGFAKDVLQKMSDEPLRVCPACGEARFAKQVTAAGFQLKGDGWYVTDFKGGNKPAPAASAAGDGAADKPAASTDAPKADTAAKPATTGASSASGPATPAGG